MHWPKFPPTWQDFHPGDPNRGQPPLPAFLMNPRAPTWIPFELRRSLEGKYGTWATRRAESSMPRSATPEQIETAAKALYEAWTSRLGWGPS